MIQQKSLEKGGERPSWLPHAEFPFESRFLDLDGNQIHYVDEGSGPTLLFVVAGAAWSFVFRDLIGRLREEFRCIALDFPGAGLSRAAQGYLPGVDAASRVLEQFLLAKDLSDITLVIHDLGGAVAFGAAARQPDRIRAMAVMETFGWSLSEENPKVARMLRLVSSRAFRAVNDTTNLLARATSTSLGIGRHLTRAGRVAFRGPYQDPDARRNALTMLRDASTADAYFRYIDRALRTTLNDRPLLLIYGEKSPVRHEFPERWKARFPDARLVVIDGAHHFPQMDDPHAVSAAIRSWWHEVVATA